MAWARCEGGEVAPPAGGSPRGRETCDLGPSPHAVPTWISLTRVYVLGPQTLDDEGKCRRNAFVGEKGTDDE